MKRRVRLSPNKSTHNLRTIDLFQALCIVNANLSEFKQLINPRINRSSGHSYYTLEFEIIILFGLTELKAQVAWKENVGNIPFCDESHLMLITGSRKTVRFHYRQRTMYSTVPQGTSIHYLWRNLNKRLLARLFHGPGNAQAIYVNLRRNCAFTSCWRMLLVLIFTVFYTERYDRLLSHSYDYSISLVILYRYFINPYHLSLFTYKLWGCLFHAQNRWTGWVYNQKAGA